MRPYRMHRSGGSCDILLEGQDIIDAIEKNFKSLAQEAELGNVAGYVLDRVEARYAPNILGGQGGVEVLIESHGQDLAHRPASKTPANSVVWIYATRADLPTPYVFDLA